MSGKIRSILTIVILFAILLVTNVISAYKFVRWDLTEEKIHTLSPNTTKLLEGLDDVIDIRVYLDGELPASLKKLKQVVEEKMEEFKAYAGSNLQFRFINIKDEGTKKEQDALRKQLEDKKLFPAILQSSDQSQRSTKKIYPGAIVSYNGKEVAMHFIDPIVYRVDENLEQNVNASFGRLEYNFLKAFRQVTIKNKQKIAFLQGHGELDERESWIAEAGLKDFYAVDRVTIDDQIGALDGYDALVIAQPDTAFSDKDRFVIDQFIMNGGKVAWFIDPINVYQDSLKRYGQTFGLTRDLGIDIQLFKYGVRLNHNLVIDKKCAPINIRSEIAPEIRNFFYFPLLRPNGGHPIVKNLDPVKSQYTSTFDFVGNNRLQKTVLLTTTDNSMAYKPPVRINYSIINITPNFGAQNKPFQLVGAMLEGQFESSFKNMLTKTFTESKDYKYLESSKNTKMLVVTDGDLIRNDIIVRPKGNGTTQEFYIGLDHERYNESVRYGNDNFFLNSMDYMLGNPHLIPLRSRRISARPLNMEKIKEEKSFWQSTNLLLPVLVIIILGAIQFVLRRRKYVT
jgi:ABC-2 type transport system permease protein